MKYAQAWDELKEWLDFALHNFPSFEQGTLLAVGDKMDELEEECE